VCAKARGIAVNSVTIKDGVLFALLAPAGLAILDALRRTAQNLEMDLVITSGTDGKHSGPDDPHYTGEAYDVRSQGLSSDDKQKVLREVMLQLQRGPADAPIETDQGLFTLHFFGFLESQGTTNEHFHFQRRNRTTFAMADYLRP